MLYHYIYYLYILLIFYPDVLSADSCSEYSRYNLCHRKCLPITAKASVKSLYFLIPRIIGSHVLLDAEL